MGREGDVVHFDQHLGQIEFQNGLGSSPKVPREFLIGLVLKPGLQIPIPVLLILHSATTSNFSLHFLG